MSLIFLHLFEAEPSTYTYSNRRGDCREALLIDPVLETAPRDAALTKSGYDAVVLEDGLEGLGDH